MPYRDFHHFYPPLRFYLLAGLQRLFGEGVLVERGMWLAFHAVTVPLVFAVGRTVAPRVPAFAAAALVALAPGPWHKTPYTLAALLGMLALARLLVRPSARTAALLGLALGFGALLRHDVAVIAAAAAAAALALSGLPRRRAAALLGVTGAVAAALVLPVVVALAAAGALAPAVATSGELSVSLTLSTLPSLAETLRLARDDPVLVALLLAPTAGAAAAALGAARRLARRQPRPEDPLVLAMALAGLALLAQAFLPPALPRLLQAQAVAFVVTARASWDAAERVGRRVGRPRLASGLVGLALALLLLPVLLAVPRDPRTLVMTGSAAALRQCEAPVELELAGYWTGRGAARRTERLVADLERAVPEGRTLLVLPSQGLFGYLARRQNPTRFLSTYAQHYPAGPHDDRLWAAVVAEIERTRVDYLLVGKGLLRSTRARGLTNHLDAQYHAVERWRRFVLFERRSERSSGSSG